MENDQIKSQIENAKKAFVTSKERDRKVGASELDTAVTQEPKQTAPQDKQLQENIMSQRQPNKILRRKGRRREWADLPAIPGYGPFVSYSHYSSLC